MIADTSYTKNMVIGLMKSVVTITIDPAMDKKIRKLQSHLIQKTVRNWSYSKTVEILLETGMKSLSASKVIKQLN